MGRALGKLKRTISVLLTAVMIVTALPQAGILAYASEAQDVSDESGESGKPEIVEEDKENSNTDDGSVAAANENASGETGGLEESEPESEASEEAESEKPDAAEETDSDATADEPGAEEETDPAKADESGAGEETDPAKAQVPEERVEAELPAGDAEQKEAKQPENVHLVQAVEEAETAETVVVRVNLPCYPDGKGYRNRNLLEQVLYAVGENGTFQRVKFGSYDENINIQAKAGEKLLVKLQPRERVQIDQVSYTNLMESTGSNVVEPTDADQHIYTFDSIPSGSGQEPVCEVDIEADYHYTLRFVDEYVSKNPGTVSKSVAFYQHAEDGTAVDVIGQVLEFSGKEMQEYLTKHYFTLETQEGYTFYSLDTNSSGMSCKVDKGTNKYTLRGSYNLGVEDITVFLLAEPTQERRLTFDIPAELKDKTEITVTATDSAGVGKTLSLGEDGSTAVANDMNVSFTVKVKDPNHTVFVTGKEGEADAVGLSFASRTMIKDDAAGTGGWESRYNLADAGISLKNGDVTVLLEQIDMYPVEFHVNPEEIEGIYVYAPTEKSFGSADYGESKSCTAWVAEGEKLKFTVTPAKDGTLSVSTSEDGSGELKASYDTEYEYDDVYTIVPTASMPVYLTVAEGYQFQFDYDESDFSVLVYNYNDGDGIEPLELSADHKYVSADGMSFRIMVKLKSDKWTAASVTYESDLDGRINAERRPEYDDSENGYLCYVAENVLCKTYGTNVFNIEGYQTYSIAFKGNEEAVAAGISLVQYEKDEWGDWMSNDVEIGLGETFEVKDGEEVCFSIGSLDSEKYRIALHLSGSGDRLETFHPYEEMTLYRFNAVGNATITAELTERKLHTVTVEQGESITAFEVEASESTSRPEGETERTGTYYVRDGAEIKISGIGNEESGALLSGYRGEVVCTASGKTYKAPMEYENRYENGEVIRVPYFTVEVTGDMTVMVDAVKSGESIISFANPNIITSATIWESGKEQTEENLYNSSTKEAVLSDEQDYYLDFRLQDGYAAQSVVMQDLNGQESVLELKEDSHRIYRLGVPQGDAKIAINAVQGYTVAFQTPADSDLRFAEDITAYGGNDITNDWTQVAATESLPFKISSGEDGKYKLSLDSDAFTLTRVLKYDSDELEYYQYKLSPVPGRELPKVVTVKAEEYVKHKVTLEYPEQIKTICLWDDNGEIIPITNKTAEVQGVKTTLGVKAITGYTAKVSVQGREITPSGLGEGDVSIYELGELSEDVKIIITAERSTQRLTYYQIGFYSEGNLAKVRDAVNNTVYSANESWEEGNEYEYPYQVLKGNSISFIVETVDGYEVDGVYANGELVKPVQNQASQKEYYTVVPVEKTLITVVTSRIEEKYPLTFKYSDPAAVKSVTVKGYELENNQLEVKAGTKLEFKVELADTKHRVTSVTMSGREAVFNKNSGYFSVTTVAGPMEVLIETVKNSYKTVTVNNKAMNTMQYKIATGEQVTESGTDTYSVDALADVLRFTVTSTKKESVPVVSYGNVEGSKIVLKVMSTWNKESETVYTYEIAVSDLPEKSEIVIQESILAGTEEKEKLKECINQYKDKYIKEEYPEESWEAYTKALQIAEECVENKNATKAEVEAAIAGLEEAVSKLTERHVGLWTEPIDDQTYTGSAIKPEIKVYYDENLLEVKKDYTVAYQNNTNAGTATVKVTGKGNFKGNDTVTFTIKPKDISDEDISVADVYAIINNKGKVTNPKVTVKFGKKTLKNNNDYKVVYPELDKDDDGRIVAGNYEITIDTKAVKNKQGKYIDSVNYTGSRTINFTVCANDIKLMSKAKITLKKTKVDYQNNDDGYGQGTEKPEIKSITIGGKDVPSSAYEVSYNDWDKIGKATVTVTACEDSGYYGSQSKTYDVTGTKLTAASLEINGIDGNGYEYTGEPIYINQEAEDEDMRTLKVTRKKTGTEEARLLEEDVDYKVSYKTGKKVGEHTNAGTVTVTITGINAYTGSVNKTFKIKPVDLATFVGENVPAERQFEAEVSAKYMKTGAKPEITTLAFNETELKEKQDYTVSYAKNTTVKTGEKSATMTIKGKGNFKGKIIHKYEVTAASEADVYATAADIVKPTKFNQVKTTVKVFETETGKALKAGTDYAKDITYYSDADCEELITAENFTDKTAVDQVIYAKVTMKGSYAGTEEEPGDVTVPFRVYDKDRKMTSKKLVVSIDTTVDRNGNPIACDNTKKKSPYYTGEEIEPKVTVTVKGSNPLETLTEGVDYKVEYSKNVNKGKATVTVTGIGNGYGGTKSMKFSIVSTNMKWAEKAREATEKALKIFSELMIQN